MLDTSLKVLKKLETAGFESYVVGGFVRDYIMGLESLDVDIATIATPRDIKEIFEDVALPKEDYGAVTLMIKNYRFEITTFRKELSYSDNRKPKHIEYISDLLSDLKRRDFRMNTVCMDSSGKIIDKLGGIEDIENKVINSVDDAIFKFYEDPLRILRAVRFATTLKFELSKDVIEAIKKTKSSLKRLSFQRKREELDKIFSHYDAVSGIKLIKDLELDKELEIYNLDQIKIDCDLIGVWATLDVSPKYPFTKNEQELIKKIRIAIKEDNFDDKVLYKYGLYVNSVAACIKGLDKKKIASKYDSLPIKSRIDIKINSKDIMKLLARKAGNYLGIILNDLEEQIVARKLENDPKVLVKYILEKYGETNE